MNIIGKWKLKGMNVPTENGLELYTTVCACTSVCRVLTRHLGYRWRCVDWHNCLYQKEKAFGKVNK